MLSTLLLTLTLVQAGAGVNALPVEYADCPKIDGGEQAIPLPGDGGYWIVPIDHLARIECQLTTCEMALSNDPAVKVERHTTGVLGWTLLALVLSAAAVGAVAGFLMPRPWEGPKP